MSPGKDLLQPHPGISANVVEALKTYLGEAVAAHSCRVYRTTDQSVSNAAITPISFNTQRWDTSPNDDIWAVANPTRLTCRLAAKYQISATVEFRENATGLRWVAIKLNNTTYLAIHSGNNLGASNRVNIAVSTLYDLQVGDYLELMVYQTSGGALDVIASATHSPEFGMAPFVGGPGGGGGGGGGAPTTASYITAEAESGLTNEKVLGSEIIMRGSAASKPAAGIAGRIYVETDSPFKIWRDNGSSWDQLPIADDAVGPTKIDPGPVWGTSAKKLLNYVPYICGDNTMAVVNGGTSAWAAQIASVPADTTTITYKNLVGVENSIVPYAATYEGHLILHNITRNDFALIKSVDTVTDTITLTAARPIAWAVNDAIQVNSLTCSGGGVTWFDLDMSSILPTTATCVEFLMIVEDSAAMNQGLRIHPYEAFNQSLVRLLFGGAAGHWCYDNIVKLSVDSNRRVCVAGAASGAATLIWVLVVQGWYEAAAT